MKKQFALLLTLAFIANGCAHLMVWRSPGFSGQVRLVNKKGGEVKGNLKGIVINMINLSGELGKTSASAVTDEKGHFAKTELTKGAYKIEVMKDGFKVAVLEVSLGSHERRSLLVDLVRLSASKRKSIKMKKGREEIRNPGQVNIQPPSM